MARGGRRRRKRGSGSGSGSSRPPRPEGAVQSPATTGEGAKRRRRRRGRGAGLTERSVIEAMSRPKTLVLLPPDGQVLEELISDLQSEYGTPATPQEYRLLIKVPLPAGAAETESQATDSIRLDPVDDEETPDGEPRRKRRRRRRGRKRRPDGSEIPVGEAGAGGETDLDGEGDIDEPESMDDVEGFIRGSIVVSDPATSGTVSAQPDVRPEMQAEDAPAEEVGPTQT